MKPSENHNHVSSDLRDQSPESNGLATRGRKRASSDLTPVGGSDIRDRSNNRLINFKKPRYSPPVGGSDIRDRSNNRLIDFKKPPRRTRKVRARGTASSAAELERVDKDKARQRALHLLRREDKRSRELDSDERREENNRHLISLLRDIEETGTIRHCSWFGTDDQSTVWTFYQHLKENLLRFMTLGDERGLQEEEQRLCRYETLLEQWVEAFKREKHSVSAWVKDILIEMLAEVRKEMSYLSRVRRLQPHVLLSKYCSVMSQSACIAKIVENCIDVLGGEDVCDPPTAPRAVERFYQSSSGKRRRSLATRNTRKWQRRLHMRTASAAQRRSRCGLKGSGHRLGSHLKHGPSLTLKPGDGMELRPFRFCDAKDQSPK